jgi:hypothetical protein
LPEIGAVAHVFGEWKDLAAQVVRGVWTAWQRRAYDLEIEREAKFLLGLDRHSGVAYRHDAVHPDFEEGVLHPDNLDALASASGSSIARARDLRQLEVLDDIRVAIEEDQVLIGSPMAEGLSRVVFGYDEHGSGNVLRRESASIDLPYSWEFDATKLAAHATAARFVRGQGWVERPNWYVVCNRSGMRDKRYTPHVDNNGRLADDYLIVTRIPNFLTESAFGMDRFIVSIAGTHGTGTRAIELLLRDKSILNEVADKLGRDCDRFQILLRAADVVHDTDVGSRATALELIDVVELTDSSSTWLDACRVAQPKLQAWLTSAPLEG